jgi:hypothetical protein
MQKKGRPYYGPWLNVISIQLDKQVLLFLFRKLFFFSEWDLCEMEASVHWGPVTWTFF